MERRVILYVMDGLMTEQADDSSLMPVRPRPQAISLYSLLLSRAWRVGVSSASRALSAALCLRPSVFSYEREQNGRALARAVVETT